MLVITGLAQLSVTEPSGSACYCTTLCNNLHQSQDQQQHQNQDPRPKKATPEQQQEGQCPKQATPQQQARPQQATVEQQREGLCPQQATLEEKTCPPQAPPSTSATRKLLSDTCARQERDSAWRQHTASSGCYYFRNTATKESSWEKPIEKTAPVSPLVREKERERERERDLRLFQPPRAD
jgi:hypothetical protein